MANQNKTKKTQEKPKTEAIVKLEDLHGFSQEEIDGGVDQIGSYTSSYPYQIRANMNSLNVVDSASGDAVHVTDTGIDKCIVFYWHPVYRLYQGAVNGVPSSAWEDRDKELVAESFASPFSRNGSRGNFDAAGYSRYLDNKELRKEVTKRLYVYLALPDILPRGSVAVGTFGISASFPLNSFKNISNQQHLPSAAYFCSLGMEKQKAEGGEAFFRPTIAPIQKAGKYSYSISNREMYLKHVKPVLDSIIAKHHDQIEAVEKKVGYAAPAEKVVSDINHGQPRLVGGIGKELDAGSSINTSTAPAADPAVPQDIPW